MHDKKINRIKALAKIGSLRWQFLRFGMLPSAIASRFNQPVHYPPVLLTSLPKTGTNLAERALFLTGPLFRVFRRTLTDDSKSPAQLARIVRSIPRGKYLTAHIPCSGLVSEAVRTHNIVVVLMVRDPRDVILSNAHYIPSDRNHRLRNALGKINDLASRVRVLITGDNRLGIPCVRWTLTRYLSWINTADVIWKFEDLVGPNGGGTREAQERCLERLHDKLHSGKNKDDLRSIATEIYSKRSPTFRVGQIYQWRKIMGRDMIELFDEIAGDLCSRLGYPSS